MKVYVRLKNEQDGFWKKYEQVNDCISEFDDALYSPFQEIITLVVTIIGVGGGSSIIIELIKKFSKSVKVRRNSLGEIEVDCTNCSIKEVEQILEELNRMAK